MKALEVHKAICRVVNRHTIGYVHSMKPKMIYKFSPEKNTWLIEVRGISFEEIIAALENKGALDVIEHPDTLQYSHQKMYVIELHHYIYLVPFIEEKDNKVFLKTAFPNRKATRQYLGK